MRIKRYLLLFLISLVVIFVVFSALIYAYEYIEIVSTSSNNTALQNASVSNNESTAQDNQAQTESTSSEQGSIVPKQYNGSTHPYNTWNNPFSWGVDGYNYTDPQDYAETSTTSYNPIN